MVEEQTAAPPRNSLLAMAAGNSPLAIIPSRLGEVVELAKAVFASGLAPYGLKGPDAVTVVILKGLEVGIGPMQALESFGVINGKAAMYGDIGFALIHRSGALEWFKEGHEGAGDDRLAFHEMKRHGVAEPVRKTFSVANAKTANLWMGMGISDIDKRAKSPWTQYGDDMLLWRARWRVWRVLFTDILKGMPGAEEMQDSTIDVTPRQEPNAKPTTDIAAKLKDGKAPDIVYTSGKTSNAAAEIIGATEAAAAAPQSPETDQTGQSATEDGEAAQGDPAGQDGPIDGAGTTDLFEQTMIEELRSALVDVTSSAALKVVADEFAGAMGMASEATLSQMREMLQLAEEGLK